jgi:hypothetical protein
MAHRIAIWLALIGGGWILYANFSAEVARLDLQHQRVLEQAEQRHQQLISALQQVRTDLRREAGGWTPDDAIHRSHEASKSEAQKFFSDLAARASGGK